MKIKNHATHDFSRIEAQLLQEMMPASWVTYRSGWFRSAWFEIELRTSNPLEHLSSWFESNQFEHCSISFELVRFELRTNSNDVRIGSKMFRLVRNGTSNQFEQCSNWFEIVRIGSKWNFEPIRTSFEVVRSLFDSNQLRTSFVRMFHFEPTRTEPTRTVCQPN